MAASLTWSRSTENFIAHVFDGVAMWDPQWAKRTTNAAPALYEVRVRCCACRDSTLNTYTGHAHSCSTAPSR